MNVGIVGLGYWGPNLVRNFLAQKNIQKVVACDQRTERLEFIKSKSPAVLLSNNYEELLKSDIDALVVATPVETHYQLAKKALEAGKHIWVEKPFTATSQQAEELLEIADKKNLRIFVDHTFIYTGAVRKMKEIVGKGELGKILHFDSVRINLGLFQKDINVIWDLAPHDLSIMNYVLSHLKPVAVSANGIANYNGKENIAHISLYFEENCFAHFHVNWTSPVKIRRMIVGGDKKMLVFDDMENFEKIKVYDAGVDIQNTASIYEALVQYRLGDMYSPKVIQTEALELAAKEFLESISQNRDPLTSGKDGLNVVRILEVADLSLQNKGQLFDIQSRVMV
jgi:predicted dehydrogenase